MLLLGGKIMTFVLYPLFRFKKIVKDWNATESFEFPGVLINAEWIQMKI